MVRCDHHVEATLWIKLSKAIYSLYIFSSRCTVSVALHKETSLLSLYCNCNTRKLLKKKKKKVVLFVAFKKKKKNVLFHLLCGLIFPVYILILLVILVLFINCFSSCRAHMLFSPHLMFHHYNKSTHTYKCFCTCVCVPDLFTRVIWLYFICLSFQHTKK